MCLIPEGCVGHRADPKEMPGAKGEGGSGPGRTRRAFQSLAWAQLAGWGTGSEVEQGGVRTVQAATGAQARSRASPESSGEPRSSRTAGRQGHIPMNDGQCSHTAPFHSTTSSQVGRECTPPRV